MSLLGSNAATSHLPPLGQTVTLFNDALAHRVELGALEFAEARHHALKSLLLCFAAACLLHFAVFALMLLIASLVWDTPHRSLWMGVLFMVYLGGGVAFALTLQRRLKTWQPFAATTAQLQADHLCLRELIKMLFR